MLRQAVPSWPVKPDTRFLQINIQTIETHMTNLPQVASVASVKVTSAITILIHIIKAGMEASANSSNPSPSNCQRILPRLLPMAMRKAISLRRWRVRNQKVPISPMNTLKTKNITMSLALRIYGVIPSAASRSIFWSLSSVCRKDRMERPAAATSYPDKNELQNYPYPPPDVSVGR